MSNNSPTRPNSLINLICICAFLVSIGINFTRVPIIYAVQQMTCDEYYRHHSPFKGPGDWCNIAEIEASTARDVSLLAATVSINGMCTIFCGRFWSNMLGIFNLIVANWSMRKFGIKAVLIQQLVGPTVRLALQLLGVGIGGSKGILVVQVSQLLGIVGGTTGYVLVLTMFVSRTVAESEKTLAFGRLQGAIMLGTAVAHLLGGSVSNALGVSAAFETACGIMCLSLVYAAFALPRMPHAVEEGEPQSTWHRISTPLRVMMSTWTRGSDKSSYQRPLLGISVFVGVLATGSIPTLLQLYSSNRFAFNSQENGYLMFISYGVRSFFLIFCYPVIIKLGRKWFKSMTERHGEEHTPLLRAGKQLKADTAFDLSFLTGSFFMEAILTAATAFSSQGWHLYTATVFLTLASGSPPAANGVMVSLCEPWETNDALAGIAMAEMLGNVLSMALFGVIFSTLASLRCSNFVFIINGALSMAAAAVAFCVKAPKEFKTPSGV